MTAGPTLHYSHANVRRCWFLALGAFVLTCLFWSKMLTGSFFSFGFADRSSGQFWQLGRFVVSPVSIFEYRWQILVLGLLMGVLAVVPVLVSQLFSFRYSIPFILAAAFIAGLGGFAVCLLLGCLGAAARPLRFRSRFIAIALCMAPQILYWAFLGGAGGLEPIKWGFSFAPWLCAWLVGLAIAAVVLGIGHFTRYRPGTVWGFTLLTMLLALWVFQGKIGFAELAYQRYIAKNNPEQVPELHDHSITAALDKTIKNPSAQRFFSQFFYPEEPILLRAALKKEIQVQMAYERWPSWFQVPDELNFQAKKQWLNRQYNLFINPPKPWWLPSLVHHKVLARRAESRRMPIALYYKALLSEYSPDIRLLERKEELHFYSDYPRLESLPIWYELYDNFGQSAESIEARRRIAMHLAGQGKFKKASEIIVQAQNITAEKLKSAEDPNKNTESLFTVFGAPAASAITVFDLTEFRMKLAQLHSLISSQNHTDADDSRQRLAKFVILDPYSRNYASQLQKLLDQTSDDDSLRDNILLAQICLIADARLRDKKLAEFVEQFEHTDGGIRGLYELGFSRFRLWQERHREGRADKNCLDNARMTLTRFVKLYPESIYAEQAQELLTRLPPAQ